MSLGGMIYRCFSIGLLVIASGCTPAQYMPQFDEATLQIKRNEIANQAERKPQDIKEDPKIALSRVYERLAPHARAACLENGEK